MRKLFYLFNCADFHRCRRRRYRICWTLVYLCVPFRYGDEKHHVHDHDNILYAPETRATEKRWRRWRHIRQMPNNVCPFVRHTEWAQQTIAYMRFGINEERKKTYFVFRCHLISISCVYVHYFVFSLLWIYHFAAATPWLSLLRSHMKFEMDFLCIWAILEYFLLLFFVLFVNWYVSRLLGKRLIRCEAEGRWLRSLWKIDLIQWKFVAVELSKNSRFLMKNSFLATKKPIPMTDF